MAEVKNDILYVEGASFRVDSDGDLEIMFDSDERSSCHGCTTYLKSDDFRALKAWLRDREAMP